MEIPKIELPEVKISEHAFERAKERLNLKRDSFIRLTNKAFYEGIRHNQFKGQLLKYINSVYLQHKAANNIMIYGEIIYFFNNSKLITVYQVPNNLKNLIKHSKSSVR